MLARWEAALEDVSLWRFAPTPTHGDLGGEEILAVFDDDEDASTGRVRAFTGWEDAKVADPADDFATLVTEASPEAVDSVLEAYAHARVDRPDQHLERRARLAGELRLVTALLAATAAQDQGTIDSCASRLRRLDEHTAHSPLTEPQVLLSPAPVIPGVSMPPVVIEEWAAPEPGQAPMADAPHIDESREPDHPADPTERPSSHEEPPVDAPAAAAGTQPSAGDEAGVAGAAGAAGVAGATVSRGGATAIDHLPPGSGDERRPATAGEPAAPAGKGDTSGTAEDAVGDDATRHDAAGDDAAGDDETGDDAPRSGATAVGFGAPGDEQDEDLTQPIPVHPPQEQHPR